MNVGRIEPKPSATPTVDEYSRDLTRLASEGRLDPLIGRVEEVETVIEILCRRTKNNPVIIGDPGVGKTAIIEGLAQWIVSGDIPDALAGKRVLSLDLSGMVAGTQYRGEFEERFKKIIEEIRDNKDDQIVFLDEMHTVIGAGVVEGSMDASNMLKPALAYGEMHLVGATTVDEYRKNIEKDAALERRLQPVHISEPGVDESVEILRGLRSRYEDHHRVEITDEAISAAAELSDRYIADRFLPDKAIDLMDLASARVRLRVKAAPTDTKSLEEKDSSEESSEGSSDEDVRPKVTADDIAQIVSRATGIPVSQLTEEDRKRLLHLEVKLHERIVGQEEAVEAVAEAIRRARAGLSDPKRPIGSFLFLGPTGVGKTELARTLAEALFGDEATMVRIDMSEFQERHAVSRLVGAPPGYVGHEEAGQLTEAVRRRPYSVMLLDEIEKAHPDVFNVLLQILDDGRLTDSQGRTVDFKNAVIIMTSNLGSERIKAHAHKDESFEDLKEDMNLLLRNTLRPEFVNRIDEVILFRSLGRDQISRIARLLLDYTTSRLRTRGIEIEFTDSAVALIAEDGFDPEFGARPLRRTIQRKIDSVLSRMILECSLERNDRVVVNAKKTDLDFKVTHETTARKPPKK